MSVVLGWSGLPAYAARLIRAAPGDFPVVATRPAVPILGMDELLPHRIKWLESGNLQVTWRRLGISVPSLYFQPSWSTPAFNSLGDEVRGCGGKVVVMFDNPWKGGARQFFGAIRFRTQWKSRFAAAWVVGESGVRLARYWGFAPQNIHTGMYGADPRLFNATSLKPLSKRPKRFIFVGQLIPRKGVADLLKAWRLFASKVSDWELHIFGTGPLASDVGSAGVVFHGFQQPATVALAMSDARFLILPSHDEHWGLVVCEAAQAGCGLLLSRQVGSHPDLLTTQNGFLFDSGNDKELALAMLGAAELDGSSLELVQKISSERGLRFTPETWGQNFNRLVSRYYQP